jgi:hypothetical protein
MNTRSRSQWPRELKRRSAAARLLRLWVRILPGTWMFVCCECFVFSGRGLCDELITRPEKSYRLWCVVVCDLETSWMRPWPTGGLSRHKQTNKEYNKRMLHMNTVHLFGTITRCSVHTTTSLEHCNLQPLSVNQPQNTPPNNNHFTKPSLLNRRAH